MTGTTGQAGQTRQTGRAGGFEVLPAGRAERWAKFGRWERTYFPSLVGLELEEVRLGYARMRLPFRPELEQPAGAVHGGAIATMIDTVVVPAVGAAYERMPLMSTIDMQVRFLGAARGVDLVAEGWVVKRGRSIAFCQSEVRVGDAAGDVIAEGWTTYKITEA